MHAPKPHTTDQMKILIRCSCSKFCTSSLVSTIKMSMRKQTCETKFISVLGCTSAMVLDFSCEISSTPSFIYLMSGSRMCSEYSSRISLIFSGLLSSVTPSGLYILHHLK